MIVDTTKPETVLIAPDLWTAGDHVRASREGWCIHIAGIETTFLEVGEINWAGPIQLREYIQEKAHQGSEFHQRALAAEMKAIMLGALD